MLVQMVQMVPQSSWCIVVVVGGVGGGRARSRTPCRPLSIGCGGGGRDRDWARPVLGSQTHGVKIRFLIQLDSEVWLA